MFNRREFIATLSALACWRKTQGADSASSEIPKIEANGPDNYRVFLVMQSGRKVEATVRENTDWREKHSVYLAGTDGIKDEVMTGIDCLIPNQLRIIHLPLKSPVTNCGWEQEDLIVSIPALNFD